MNIGSQNRRTTYVTVIRLVVKVNEVPTFVTVVTLVVTVDKVTICTLVFKVGRLHVLQ